MHIIANLCLGLALLIAIPVFSVGLRGAGNPSSMDFAFVFVIVPYWLFLTIGFGFGIATARSNFDWLCRSRGLQYVLVLSACAALAVTMMTTYDTGGGGESPSPDWVRVLRLVALTLPLVTTLAGFLTLNPTWGAGLSPQIWRAPLVLIGSLSLLLGIGVVAVAVVGNIKNTNAAVQREISSNEIREASYLAEAQTLDPVTGIDALMQFTNIFHAPTIRAAALDKLRSHPGLNAAIARRIHDGACDEPFRYFEGADVPISQELAEPVRDAIICMAGRMRKTLREDGTHYDVNFDADTRRVLAVADRFKPLGVDYVPAMREFRAAMDEPNRFSFAPRCRATIDKWIAAQNVAAR